MIQDALTYISPAHDERPVDYADRLGVRYLAGNGGAHQKKWGQYLTPPGVADFIAGLFTSKAGVVHVLDPGAGAGALACACGEYLARSTPIPEAIHFHCYETDNGILPLLDKSLHHLKTWLTQRKVKAVLHINNIDFVLKHAGAVQNNASLFDGDHNEGLFDYCIMNPPYFKLAKADPRVQAVLPLVHGQPNIYALFLAIAARLLKTGGELAAITPRSFCSGAYFRRFRELFFETVSLNRIHLFQSRRETFKRDQVLQENIIIKATRHPYAEKQGGGKGRVVISTCEGLGDVDRSQRLAASSADVLDPRDPLFIVKVPASKREQEILHQMKRWPGHLRSHQMEISTGPVVPFRARSYLREKLPHKFPWAPFFWMQHVCPMEVNWPVKLHKPQYFGIDAGSMPLLVYGSNYVLLRRFSAKEDVRRLIAAPLEAEQYPHEYYALENHLNYIHRPGGKLTIDEIWGLAALLNSSLYEGYFRITNGNTQVSATEIRAMPLPDLEHIKELGRVIRAGGTDIDERVEQLILRSGELLHV